MKTHTLQMKKAVKCFEILRNSCANTKSLPVPVCYLRLYKTKFKRWLQLHGYENHENKVKFIIVSK